MTRISSRCTILKIEIVAIHGTCTCNHSIGDFFRLEGGALRLPDGQHFCLYALQSTLPLLPAKQRALDPNDWMTTDAEVVCPDPLCGVVMVIRRDGRRTFQHSDVSAVPLNAKDEDNSDG